MITSAPYDAASLIISVALFKLCFLSSIAISWQSANLNLAFEGVNDTVFYWISCAGILDLLFDPIYIPKARADRPTVAVVKIFLLSMKISNCI